MMALTAVDHGCGPHGHGLRGATASYCPPSPPPPRVERGRLHAHGVCVCVSVCVCVEEESGREEMRCVQERGYAASGQKQHEHPKPAKQLGLVKLGLVNSRI